MKAISYLFSAAIFLAGCTTEIPLVSSTPILFVDMEKAVISPKGLNVTIAPNAWYGDPKITEDVMPLKITVLNGSSTAIRIRYHNMVLTGNSGRRYAALPPYKIEGTENDPVITAPDKIYSNPSFRFNKFRIPPYYGSLYPNIPQTEGPFYIDPLYQDRHYRYWSETSLPTPQMLESALLEGEMEPKGEVSGYVYFERLDDETAVTFNMDLIDTRTGDSVGTVTIPMHVK